MRLFKIAFLALFASNAFSQSIIEANHSESSNKNSALVYLLHGLGRSKTAVWLLASRLEEAGFAVNRIDYSSLHKSPEEIMQDVSQQILAGNPQEFQTVHFVGHSLGGLLIRAYLEKNKVKNLGRVVLLGTPNKGTPLVDKYRDSWWLQLLGPTTLALGTDENSFPSSIADPYYPVGVIAGVAVGIENEDLIPGQDDGLVPLESTKVNGMTDMVIIESGHSMMRYNEDVARQTIAFLRHGKFYSKGNPMEFIEHSIRWCKGEIFEGRLLALFGLLVLIISILLGKMGSTPFSKAMFIPMVLVALFCLSTGLTMNFSNQKRIVQFQKEYKTDAQNFIASEKNRTDTFIKWYPYTMYILSAIIIAGILFFILFGPSPMWRAIGLALILLGFSGLFLDHFSEERADVYHKHIEEYLETKR
ncbi:MAG: hypothetical protein DWQ05_15775 [Calditrichaeota bacterium]|nr:MAG: hypothetical protein DWQ05_15775 [Calditrichota bacterium]